MTIKVKESPAVINSIDSDGMCFELTTDTGPVRFSIVEFWSDYPNQKPEVGDKAIVLTNDL